MLLAASVAVAPVAAATGKPLNLSTVVVNHFTNANGMGQSQDFIQFFADYVSEQLVKDKVAGQVVDQGTTVSNAVAANSVVIEGKFLSHEDAGLIKPGKLMVEISIYRLSDHALVKTWAATTHFPINGDRKDRPYAFYTGGAAADLIWDALKSVDLSSIAPAAAGASPRAVTRGVTRVMARELAPELDWELARQLAQRPRRHPTPRLQALTLLLRCSCLRTPPELRSRSMAGMWATHPVSSSSGQGRTRSR